MAKDKNKSFVEIKENDVSNNENIIDPFKKYEYIEEKKKFPIKNILLIFFSILIIILIIIFLKLINMREEQMNMPNNKQEPLTNTHIDNNKTTSTTPSTTSSTTISTTKKDENDQITEALTCYHTQIENGISIENEITTYFANGKLRSELNILKVDLLDEINREEFDSYINVLKIFSISLDDENTFEIDQTEATNNYTISIKTTYEKNKNIESSFTYDESYDSIKKKLIEGNYNCN